MGNEVEKTGVFGDKAAMINPAALAAAMADSAARDPRGAAADGNDYMNFSGKRGVYEIGTEKRDTTPDELWLVNPYSWQDGYVCWKGGRSLAKRMSPVGTPVPKVDQTEHGPFDKDGDGWYQAKAFVCRSIDNPMQQVIFTINSVSGVSVFADLQKAITNQLIAGHAFYPVIGFGKEGFTAQGFKNFKPVITIDGWLSHDQVTTELPKLFDSPDAEIDLDAMYREADGPMVLPTNGETVPATAKRNRRGV